MKSKAIMMLRTFALTFFIGGLIGWSVDASALQFLSIGDSLTQGLQRTGSGAEFGITSPVFGAANIGGYQPRLKTKLDANIEPSNVYNWGYGGDLSSGNNNGSPGGVARIGPILNTRAADYILIMYGANDLYAGISSSATSANVGNMIDQSKAKGVVPIISEITPNIYFAGGIFDNLIANDYNPKLKAMAAQRNTEIVLMFFEMRTLWQSTYNSGDGLHMSNAGYEKMSQEWFEVIEQVHRSNNANLVPFIKYFLLD